MSKGRDQKPHIGIFGRRNKGKSSFINVLVGQEVSIVSEQAGTTTDPVRKSIEIFGIGPAIIVDTAGIDDTGELGEKRIQKTQQVLKTIDCAVLIIAENQFGPYEIQLLSDFAKQEVPFIIVHNKSDLQPLTADKREEIAYYANVDIINFSARIPKNLETVITSLKKTISEIVYVRDRKSVV